MEAMNAPRRKLSFLTATNLIITSMVGTGIFTSTGYQAKDLESVAAILFAWVLGGVTALCGALTYAELVTLIPKNGGEYQLLSKIYHPSLGFLMGWVSLTVGFGAPIAAVAYAFGQYLSQIHPWFAPQETAVILIVALGVVHTRASEKGIRFQDFFTLLKFAFVILLIIAGMSHADWSLLKQPHQREFSQAVFSSKFSIGLIYVAFAYSGWNAAAYIAGEVRDPNKTLPRAFFLGTLIVTIIYVLMNLVYLSAVPLSELAGKIEVGHVVAEALFGQTAAKVMSGIIALGLLTTVGAMIISGARVLEALGEDFRPLNFLVRQSQDKPPVFAVWVQSVISLILLMVAGFDTLIEYTGFTVTAGLSVTIFAIFVARRKKMSRDGAYRTWGYPWTSIAYFILSLWMLIGMVFSRPFVSLAGAATLLVGLLLYWVVQRANP